MQVLTKIAPDHNKGCTTLRGRETCRVPGHTKKNKCWQDHCHVVLTNGQFYASLYFTGKIGSSVL